MLEIPLDLEHSAFFGDTLTRVRASSAQGAWTWPDGPARREALGHQSEPDCPGYCTCGELTAKCPARPREWSRRDVTA